MVVDGHKQFIASVRLRESVSVTMTVIFVSFFNFPRPYSCSEESKNSRGFLGGRVPLLAAKRWQPVMGSDDQCGPVMACDGDVAP